MPRQLPLALAIAAGLLLVASSRTAIAQRWLSGIIWPEPAVVSPGHYYTHNAPSDAIVLFDGKNLNAWQDVKKTTIDHDSAFTVMEALQTKQSFGDCQLHLEFATPLETKDKKGKERKGQARGNNGVGFMQRRYEIQVLDSFGNTTYPEGFCGSVYNQRPPMVNASRQPGEWQTYDIIFTAPRFGEDGKVLRPAYFTILHNGVLVHNHTEVKGTTIFDVENKYEKHPEKLPLVLMYHGDPVRFRNIWIREFKELVGKTGGKVGKETSK